MTDAQREQLYELAFDHLDELNGEDRRVVEYVLDQALNGGLPMYHENGERPPRERGDLAVLADAALARLRRRFTPSELALVSDAPPTSLGRTWADD